MKKSLFTLDDTEKTRILEMHLNAIKKETLKEQNEIQQSSTPSTGTTEDTKLNSVSTIGDIQIPGFLFAEDDKEWLISKNKETNGKVSKQIISDENYSRLARYYGLTLPLGDNSVDPSIFIGKNAIMFNSKPLPDTYKYEKGNVVGRTFKIGKVYKNENQTMVFMTTGGAANTGLNVRIPQKSTTSYRENFYLYDGNSNLNDVNNPYTNGLFGLIDINKTNLFKNQA